MRRSRWAVLLLAPMLFAAGAFAQKVATDYDRSADFTKYKTYSWAESKNPAQNPLWDARIKEQIEEQLAAKGLRKVEGPADITIAYNGNLRENTSLQGFGTGGRWVGGSFSVNKVTETEGTLIVDVADNTSRQLVWRGVVTETASKKSDKNIAKLEKAIGKLFKEFPPKGKQ